MSDQPEFFKPDNASIKKLRARVVARKQARRDAKAVPTGRTSRKPTKLSSQELWSKVWQRINAERATGAALELETNTTAPTSDADRIAAARKRGMKEGID